MKRKVIDVRNQRIKYVALVSSCVTLSVPVIVVFPKVFDVVMYDYLEKAMLIRNALSYRWHQTTFIMLLQVTTTNTNYEGGAGKKDAFEFILLPFHLQPF